MCEQLFLTSQNVECEWCQVGHLECLIDDDLAAYDANVNVLQLQTNERTTVVSDLLQSISGDVGCVDRCTDAELPSDYSRSFRSACMQYIHRRRDLAEFVRYFMLPKRRFWKAEQTFGNVFPKHFSHT